MLLFQTAPRLEEKRAQVTDRTAPCARGMKTEEERK